MKQVINERKLAHIRVITEEHATDRNARYFDNIQLTHYALPEIARSDVDPSITFLGRKLTFPFIISSMTGGNCQLLHKVNRNLAIAAQETGVAMAVGSQRIMFEDKNSVESFKLRKYAPDVVLLSNLGAVQLNYGLGLRECKKAIEVLEGDGIYFHLNPLQEAVQPEGDTNFANLWDKIDYINKNISQPLLIKEVGCGLNESILAQACKRNIKYIDVAGQGGLSWSKIESHRSAVLKDPLKTRMGELFQDWGISTIDSLNLAFPWKDKITLIASGGIRNGIDMIKSVILGAQLCSLASPLLKPAMESEKKVIEEINLLKETFITAMFLLGATSLHQIRGNRSLLSIKT